MQMHNLLEKRGGFAPVSEVLSSSHSCSAAKQNLAALGFITTMSDTASCCLCPWIKSRSSRVFLELKVLLLLFIWMKFDPQVPCGSSPKSCLGHRQHQMHVAVPLFSSLQALRLPHWSWLVHVLLQSMRLVAIDEHHLVSEKECREMMVAMGTKAEWKHESWKKGPSHPA